MAALMKSANSQRDGRVDGREADRLARSPAARPYCARLHDATSAGTGCAASPWRRGCRWRCRACPDRAECPATERSRARASHSRAREEHLEREAGADRARSASITSASSKPEALVLQQQHEQHVEGGDDSTPTSSGMPNSRFSAMAEPDDLRQIARGDGDFAEDPERTQTTGRE